MNLGNFAINEFNDKIKEILIMNELVPYLVIIMKTHEGFDCCFNASFSGGGL